MRTEDKHAVCKCLGRDTEQPDVTHPWKTTYADEKIGVLRGIAMEHVLFLKKTIEEIPWKEIASSSFFNSSTPGAAAAERTFHGWT